MRISLGKLEKIKDLVTDKQNMMRQLNCRILLKVALTSTTHEVLFGQDLLRAGPMKMRLLINSDKRHMLLVEFTMAVYSPMQRSYRAYSSSIISSVDSVQLHSLLKLLK
jgi:hypothetical protein